MTDAPALTLALTIWCQIGAMETIGDIPTGQGRIIPITGGAFEGQGPAGQAIAGQLMPGGADWQTVRADGIVVLDAHYGLRTDDGAIIQVMNHVLVRTDAPAPVGQPAKRTARGAIRFTAPKGPHDWLNRAIFVSTLNAPPDPRAPVTIRAYSAG